MAAIELGAPYSILTPDQSDWFDLNQPTSDKYVGRVLTVTGLDSADVRESAVDNPAGDGGTNDTFWRGRRPWTIGGIIQPQFPVTTRGQAQEQIETVMSSAMRSDGYLTWTPSDGVTKFLAFRCQQPTRITEGQSNADKRFLIAGVADEWRIRAATISSAVGTGLGGNVLVTVVSNGRVDAAPRFEFDGPLTAPYTINNQHSLKAITSTGPSLADGDSAVLDLSGPYPFFTVNGVDQYAHIDPLHTDWEIAVVGGTSQRFQLTDAGSITSATHLTVKWYDSWA